MSFYDFSGASNARITNNASGTINFNGNSTAGAPDASIRNFGTINFNESSSAGNATITNNNIVNLTCGSAGNATIINGDGFNNIGSLSFNGGSAANATITNNAGSTVSFSLSSSAAGAKITNNAGTITFSGNTSAGDAQIINTAPAGTGGFRALEFKDFATATNATIRNNSGVDTLFSGKASGGNARLIANDGRFDFVGLESPGTTVGSIEGSGIFFLGSKILTVGGNNLSTTVTGRIGDSCLPPADCRNFDPPAPVGGSLVKVAREA
jgi:hypothetical protein